MSVAWEERLDAEHRAALGFIPEGMIDLSDVPAMRARTDTLLAAAAARQQPTPGVRIEDAMVPGAGERPDLSIRFYVPEDVADPAPVFLYIHGGGFVVGSVWHFDVQCSQIAAGARVIVASIEYRRAPEHPYPIPVADSYAALLWLHAEAEARGFDARRIGVGGPSAGAGLAAGVALLARDRGAPAIAYQFLEAPMLDPRGLTASSAEVEHSKVWNRAANAAAWICYLGESHGERAVDCYAAPALATDLNGLPPTYMCIGLLDLFRDEAIDYAQRLAQAGNSVEFHLYEMGFHGSPRMIPASAVSERWKAETIAAIARLSAGAA